MTARRRLLRALGAGILVARICPASGQQGAKIPRVGVLWFGDPRNPVNPGLRGSDARFRQRLAELGYIEGKTVVFDMRYAEGDMKRLPQLARELVASGVDIIVAPAVPASVAARQATSTIPIVMLHAGNPIGAGLIASLPRPGGNVTGTTNLFLGGKQIQLLHEFVPRLARLAVLGNPSNAGTAPNLAEVSAAARSLNIALTVVEVSRVDDFANAFTAIRNARPDGLFVLIEPLIGSRSKQVIEFAASLRLPLASDSPGMAREGALMAYGPDFLDHYNVGADYVAKILQGARPADLPVQQSRKFEFVINRKTAKALGLTIPQALLMLANEVID
jgi:putative tryptophan/tyrosine transport system substrate-binding protein